MNNLTTALSNALSGLMVASGQSAVVSRNVARAGEVDYTRKQAVLTTNLDGSARIANITRNSDQQLLSTMLSSNSSAAGGTVLQSALTTLSSTIGDVEADGSIAWGIGQMRQSISNFQANPASGPLASQAMSTARTLVTNLNSASAIVQGSRNDADAGMAQSVSNINSLLSQFQKLNTAITSGNSGDGSTVEAMDQRDGILKKLSDEIGIKTINQPNNGLAIYTDGGVTLFDVSPRTVAFAQSQSLTAGVDGNAVYIDGVQITGSGAPLPSGAGKLVSFAKIRDQVAPTYQSQLDEIARNLINIFAESDQQTNPASPPATGLFSYSGSPLVPAAANVNSGLAASISLNAKFDDTKGGNPMLLRDGGSNGAAYLYNKTGVAGYQDRLSGLTSAFDQNMTFASGTQLPSATTLKDYASGSASWISAQRTANDNVLQNATALNQRSIDALSNASGVNIDTEMATLLNLEKSYQASAKVLTTVDQMFSSLVAMVK